jgi:hypothetical protein
MEQKLDILGVAGVSNVQWVIETLRGEEEPGRKKMKKLIPYAKLMEIAQNDHLVKAIINDRLKDVKEGWTSKWTRKIKGFVVSLKKVK